MMKKRKFDILFEGTFQRYQAGGFLIGDLITFKKGALSDPWVKDKPSQFADKLRSFVEGDRNLRVTNVKAIRPASAGDSQADNQVDGFYLDIVREIGPGQFMDFMTIPSYLVDIVETGINEPPIPDSLKRKDTSHIKPEEDDDDLGEESPTNGRWQTRRHAKKEDLSNPKKNIKLKSKEPVDNFTTRVYAESLAELDGKILEEKDDSPCWDGYKKVEGKKDYEDDSCVKEEEEVEDDEIEETYESDDDEEVEESDYSEEEEVEESDYSEEEEVEEETEDEEETVEESSNPYIESMKKSDKYRSVVEEQIKQAEKENKSGDAG